MFKKHDKYRKFSRELDVLAHDLNSFFSLCSLGWLWVKIMRVIQDIILKNLMLGSQMIMELANSSNSIF